MPLSKLQFRPGINKEATSYANEGGFYSCDKVRFRSGYPEKIGGWVRQSNYTFKGVARMLTNWASRAGENLLAFGTNQKFYIEYGGQYQDITPIRSTATLGASPFSTVSGSKIITVTHTSHGATVGTFVAYSGCSTVAGLNLDGEHEIITTPDTNTYTIIAPDLANATTTGGGASVSAAYQINAGSAYAMSMDNAVTGWGYPAWGGEGWGSSANPSESLMMGLWCQYNFNDDLILAPHHQDIYYWVKDTSTFARAVTLKSFAETQTRVSAFATFGSSVTTITVDSNFLIGTGQLITCTGIPAGTYVGVSYDGGVTIPLVDAAGVAVQTTASKTSEPISFSYASKHVPNKTAAILVSSINGFVIALGSNPYNPVDYAETYDPMIVRWSDQSLPWEWVPEVSNQAGEQRLSNGSYLVCAVNTRQEILIWSDSALYSMQYLGPPYTWGFNLLMDNISIMSSHAAVTVNNVTYWMGMDKFFQYSGRVDVLPCTIRTYVFGDFNEDQAEQVVCGTNEGFNEVWWFYPSKNSLVNDSYVIYNYLENVWYYGRLNRSAWLDSGIRAHPMGMFSVQNTYLGAAISDSDTTIQLLNGASYPESGVITIGSEDISYDSKSTSALYGCVRGINNTTAAAHSIYDSVTFKTPNQVMYHEIGVDDASGSVPVPIEAYVESADFDIGDGHNFGFVWRIIPDLTFVGSTANNPSVLLSVMPRRNSGAAYHKLDEKTVTRTATYPVEQYTEQVYTRVRGRQMSFRIDSTAAGVNWQMGAMRVDVRPDGRR